MADTNSSFVIDIIDNHDKFTEIAQRDGATFKPMGTKVGEYTIEHEGAENSVFEFYQVALSPRALHFPGKSKIKGGDSGSFSQSVDKAFLHFSCK